MRKTLKRNKRRSFGSIFLRALAVALAVSCLLIYIMFAVVTDALFDTAENSRDKFFNDISQAISLNEHDKKPNTVEFKLTFYSSFYTLAESVIDPDLLSRLGYQLNDRCHAVGAIYDKDGKVLLDNHSKLLTVMKFAKEDDRNGIYMCDPEKYDIPELDALFRKYDSIPRFGEYIQGDHISSAYVDWDTFEMIPHEIHMSIIDDRTNTVKSEDDFTINCDDPRFELIDLKRGEDGGYPRYLTMHGGESPEVVKEMLAECTVPSESSSTYAMRETKKNVERIYERKERVVYKGEEAYLYSIIRVNIDRTANRLIFLTASAGIIIVLSLIALLYSIRKHMLNKADCAMEDYQRSITNNLAHDIKTPLAAIGGYAENLGEMMKESTDSKQQKYVQTIIENVAYIDNVVNRALKLNQADQTEKLNRTALSVRSLVDEAADRYRTELDERGISFSADGDANISADRDMMISAIENLISNAVKYTRNDGEIKVTIDKKRLSVVNTVSGKVDTTDLKKPFVKGDSSRSDRSSSGLGLSIAETYLERNGFRLKISCTNDSFRSEILF